MKASTRSFFREAKSVPDYSFWDWLHGYIYGRWPYLYISVATGEHPMTRFFLPVWQIISKIFQPVISNSSKSDRATSADTYHGKVMPLKEASKLVMINEDINLGDLEQIIPYTRARDIVLHNPNHIVALECPCRASRSDPCLPLDICLVVGEPFSSFVIDHHPRRSRWITQEEAVEILREEHKQGHVHHAFFKDAMLGRFYAICNCCSCCCGAMQAWRNGTPMLAPSGYVCRIDYPLCEGCGTCVESCQFGALELRNGKVYENEELCMGCGVCVSKCERGAHSLVLDPAKGEPLDIHNLIASMKELGRQ